LAASSTSGTDWKSKYYEATDLLTETKAELDEFQIASKELEEELERELQRTETEKEKLRIRVSKAERESEDWKVTAACFGHLFCYSDKFYV
jgi:predicted metalloenzyme YecM